MRPGMRFGLSEIERRYFWSRGEGGAHRLRHGGRAGGDEMDARRGARRGLLDQGEKIDIESGTGAVRVVWLSDRRERFGHVSGRASPYSTGKPGNS